MRPPIIILTFACTAFAFSALFALWRARQAERLYPPMGKFVEVEGARLHYIREGAGPTVLLVHGSDGFLQDFPTSLVDSLAAQFDVIAIDRPGHGYSDGPVGEAAMPVTQVRLILGALHELGVEEAIWVAHSWGALLAMIAAIEQPDSVTGLVLLAPWIYPPTSAPPLVLSFVRVPVIGKLLAAACAPIIKGVVIRNMLRSAFFPANPPQEFVGKACRLWLRNVRQIEVFALESLFDRKDLRRYSPEYGDITVPIVTLVGDSDRLVPSAEHAERLKAARPATELIRLEKTGHEIPHTQPCIVADAVDTCRRMIGQIDCSATLSPTEVPKEHARRLVIQHGWNATAYQILNPRMELWFDAAGDAVIGFVSRNGFRVVAGAPICPETRVADVTKEFEAAAMHLGERVCYFGAAARLQSALERGPGHCSMAVGAQPVWNPQAWRGIISQTPSLRAQLNRAKNKAVVVREWTRGEAENSPVLVQCLAEWLATRALPTLRFLTEPVDLANLQDRRVFVAEIQEMVVGYLVTTPIPDRNGWLIEQIVRGKHAPNGVAELLVDGVMEALVGGGYTYVTLGLSPLSSRVESVDISKQQKNIAMALLLRWVRAHGRRFYNFDGLEMFKAKFRPEAWEPITMITNEPRMSLQALHAVAAAFSAGPPIRAVLKAMVIAARQEAVWIVAKMRKTGKRE